MRKTNWLERAAALALAVSLCCAMGAAAVAQAVGKPLTSVRVPCGINELLRVDASGQPTGYLVDYLNALAQINDWQYEYVETDWNGAIEMLQNGELDLLFPTNYTAEREKTMDFSTMVGGYTAPGLFARADSHYDYEDYDSFNGARIAVTRGSSNEHALIELAQSKGFTYEPYYINSNAEKIQALSRGEVDMIILTADNDLANTVLVAVMESAPFYFAVKKGDAELLAQLNQGMQQMIKEKPELVTNMIRQCLMGAHGSMLAFTQEERDFVESGREVVIGFYEETKPLAYVEPDGTCNGIYVKLLENVRAVSGANIVFRPISRDKNWQDLVASGVLDFFIGASSSLAAQDPDFCTTRTFFPYDNVLVTRSDCAFSELDSPVIALTNGRFYLNHYVSTTLRAAEIRYYHSAKDCFLAVMNGEVDGTVLNNVEYNYQSKNPRFAGLIQWENYRVSTEGGLMASVDVDPVMFSVMDKATGVLTDNLVNTTITDNLNMPYDATLTDSLYASRYLLVAVAVVLLTAAVTALVISSIRKRQKAILAEAQAHERHQMRILAALSRDYDAIYYTDLNADTCEEVRVNDAAEEGAGRIALVGDVHSESLRQYVDRFVQPEYYEALQPLSDPRTIIQRFQDSPDFSVRYQVKPNKQGQEYFELHMVDVATQDREHAVVFGLRCVDEVVRAETDQRQLLQEALAAANRANNAKTDFFSRMSHDIRTPMNAIIGMTAIAGAHLDDTERVKDALGKIASSSRYLLGLINEVLDMSKIESGAITLNEEAFNLSDLLNNLLIMIQPQIKQHGHELEVHIQDIQHEDVIGDSLRIQQVFVNIMGNAAKYTPDGGRISLTVREKPSRTAKVGLYEFVFQDNGIGMSQEYVDHIFEPFTRAEDLRVSKVQGTGLGMSIAQNIVRQMDGDIKVESEVNKGSTFTVDIFLKLQESQEMDASGLVDLPVLVVDDDQDACDSVCELLDQIGMKSTGCTSGKVAVKKVEETMGTPDQFYAAILDWKMPEMDGVETAKAIRRVAGDEMPVIILSAYDWSDIEPEARAAGVDAFLSKPVFKSGLIRQFKTLQTGDKGQAYAPSDPNQLQGLQDSDYHGSRVLLVEDNDLNREIAREILEMAGLEVEEAENGKIAVDKVLAQESGYYRMIFMDIQMPVMSGYDAAMAIRSLGRSDSLSVPIIAMTANAFVEDVQASKAAGMNEHLAKPLDFDKLNVVLRKYLT